MIAGNGEPSSQADDRRHPTRHGLRAPRRGGPAPGHRTPRRSSTCSNQRGAVRPSPPRGRRARRRHGRRSSSPKRTPGSTSSCCRPWPSSRRHCGRRPPPARGPSPRRWSRYWRSPSSPAWSWISWIVARLQPTGCSTSAWSAALGCIAGGDVGHPRRPAVRGRGHRTQPRHAASPTSPRSTDSINQARARRSGVQTTAVLQRRWPDATDADQLTAALAAAKEQAAVVRRQRPLPVPRPRQGPRRP